MELRFCKQIDKNRIDAALGLFAPSVQSTLRARSDWIIEHGGARSELIFERLELCSGRSERSELIIECSLGGSWPLSLFGMDSEYFESLTNSY